MEVNVVFTRKIAKTKIHIFEKMTKKFVQIIIWKKKNYGKTLLKSAMKSPLTTTKIALTTMRINGVRELREKTNSEKKRKKKTIKISNEIAFNHGQSSL